MGPSRLLRVPWISLVVVCGLALAGAWPATGLAAAAAKWGQGIEAALPTGAAASPGVMLTSISCPSAGNCGAIGAYYDKNGDRQGVLLTEISGKWGPGVMAQLPGTATSPQFVTPDSISCPSAGNCTAVGTYTDINGTDGVFLTQTRGTWARGLLARLPLHGSNDAVTLHSVSCPSVGNCSVVGDFADGNLGVQALVFSETAGHWARGGVVALPNNAMAANQNSDLNSVVCPSNGNCTAVGFYADTAGNFQPLVLSEGSGKWAAGKEPAIPTDAGAPGGAWLNSVSCPSAGNCGAVGYYYGGNLEHGLGLMLTETAGTWARGVRALLPAGANSVPMVNLRSVSCSAPGRCTAVGLYSDTSGYVQGLLLTQASGKWARGVKATLPANAGGVQGVDLRSVSCSSAGNCSAVGIYYDSVQNTFGVRLNQGSGKWAPGFEAGLPTNADGSRQDVEMRSVSCTSSGNCNAVGSYRDRSGNSVGLLLGTVIPPPKNTARPVISGPPKVSLVLKTTTGKWSSLYPLVYAYRWERCSATGRGCNKITGATKSSYRLTSADTGHKITVMVTATDPAHQMANSTATPVGPVKK